MNTKQKAQHACKVCGCTDEFACPGGCGWATKDTCTRCFKVNIEQLHAELQAFERIGLGEINFSLGGLAAFNLIGLLQLALRHPNLSQRQKDFLTGFAVSIKQSFPGGMVQIHAAIAKGFDPGCDQDRFPQDPARGIGS